jgi:hypothetical protein
MVDRVRVPPSNDGFFDQGFQIPERVCAADFNYTLHFFFFHCVPGSWSGALKPPTPPKNQPTSRQQKKFTDGHYDERWRGRWRRKMKRLP